MKPSVPPFRRVPTGSCAVIAACALLGNLHGAEKTYTYFRFEPTQIISGSTQIQLSEFTFSLGGTLLNLNDNNGSGIDAVTVGVTCGAQDPDAGEGPNKVVDGDVNTKWFHGSPLEDLIFTFGSAVTIDSYNWASANDSVGFNRSPVSWNFYGSDDGETWTLLDARNQYPITHQNLTYQDGFAIPDEVAPYVGLFALDFAEAGNVPAIALNGSSFDLAWETEFADEVTISPAPGSVAGDGFDTVTPPDNSTTLYTITAAQTSTGAEATAVLPLRTVAPGTASYQYLRFTATQLRSGNNTGLIQISEFDFYFEDGEVVPVAATSVGGNTPANEGLDKLFDGIEGDGNKWLDFGNAAVVFDFGEVVTVDSYAYFLGNDAPDRDPIQWRIEGSNDQESWTLVDHVDFDYPHPTVRNIGTGVIPIPGNSLPPLILSFTGDAKTVVQGEPWVLYWATAASDGATISPDLGAVAAEGSWTLHPSTLGTFTYTLEATSTGNAAVATASVSVEVIAAPSITEIDYDDFSSSSDELEHLGPSGIDNAQLQLTPAENSLNAASWFRLRKSVAGGFEARIGLNLTTDSTVSAADGLAFVVQNHPEGSAATNPGPAENGLGENALNLKIESYGGDPNDGSTIEVRAGSEVLASVSAYQIPGVRLRGLAENPYTLATPTGSAPYELRMVYVPGDLDVYLDGIAVIQNVDVDLAEIGAVDAEGTAYLGFTGRTGGINQRNAIAYWKMAYGDFTESHDFEVVTTLPFFDPETGELAGYDLVWWGTEGMEYEIHYTEDLGQWEYFDSVPGIDGQGGYRIPSLPGDFPREFYRVEEVSSAP
ncbi:hypothetical protein HNR46_003256 [Haloferula luteola]|uniref:F5/8 type C domain-containing protein n=1 Tax=Haloferula luteola TaxID=595692 RepID=A0A840V5T9_9BACT|nr:discoidin domain-containing protein [Haloferula luteola]MBB5353003.1 hypothetical protein [Haloferula luteola]